MSNAIRAGWRNPRAYAALAILVCAYFLQDPIETWVGRQIAHAAHLHMFKDGVMSLVTYGVLMLIRLVWDALLVLAVWALLGRPFSGFPVKDNQWIRHLAIGMAIGLTVMIAAILCIVMLGDARISASAQSGMAALKFGAGWLLFDGLGALGEELYGRAAILLIAERFVGWKGAILVSGFMFSAVHLGNPGVSAMWLLRLCLQGILLAYAVYRTQSLWWSVGYHTGWNWASAPLFGAAGSGYLDEGHLFNFLAQGPERITGGAVGPEGSLFAFIAVLVAFALLLATTSTRRRFGVERVSPAAL